MLDWLRRSARETPTIEIAGQALPIEVRRLAHARRLTLRLAPDGRAVRVTIPTWAPTREALDFCRARADWLAQQLDRMPAREPLQPGSHMPWRGASLRLVHDTAAPRRVRVNADEVVMGGPADSLVPRLRRWVQAEARVLFAADIADYAQGAGVPIPALALTSAQRRWGSCTARGEIRLNWRLALAPDFVRRSVAAHEVAHLVHFDHSPAFHALLGAIYEDDIDSANRWLKRYGRSLYAPLG